MMSLRRVVASIVLVGVLPTIAACSEDAREQSSPSTAVPSTSSSVSGSVTATGDRPVQVPGLTATLEQYREDEIEGFISVKTSNQSTSVVQFHDLRLQWPGMTNNEPYARSTQLAPGVTFDVRVLVGDAVCGDPPRGDSEPPTEAAVAVGSASIDGASPVDVAVPIHDEALILPKVFQRSCVEQRLTWAADLRFGDNWTPSSTADGKPAVLGSIELRRRESDDTLAVTKVNGSVLLRINPDSPSDPVAVLEPDQAAASIPITIQQSGNCAPHALIESKKTFIIRIGFVVGGDEPAAYVITFDAPARNLLNEMINESCGLT
jgi:hypothetical protein